MKSRLKNLVFDVPQNIGGTAIAEREAHSIWAHKLLFFPQNFHITVALLLCNVAVFLFLSPESYR